MLLVRWTGRLADRVDSRLLLVATGLAQAAACVALAFASGPVEIIALVAVLAAGLAVTQPCLSALLPSMVPADDLPKAMALSQTAGSLGMMLAPALGGLLMGRFGLRVPLLADAGSYLAIAAAGRLIRTRRGVSPRPLQRIPSEAGDEARHGVRSEPGPQAGSGAPNEAGPRARDEAPNEAGPRARDGWGVRRDPLVRAAVVLVGAVVAAASLVNVAEVFFIRATLHSTASAYGLMESVWVTASVAGGWWVAHRRPSEPDVARLLLGSLALTCLGVALMATVPAVGWLAPVSMLGRPGQRRRECLRRRAAGPARARRDAGPGVRGVRGGRQRGQRDRPPAGRHAAGRGTGARRHRRGRAGRPGGHRGIRAAGPAGHSP